VALALVAGCSSTPKRKDSKPTEQKTEQVDERGLPTLAPLELAEEAPEAEKVESVGDVTEYQVGSLRVLHKQTTANRVVAARLYVVGGSGDLTEKTAGVQKFALNVAVNGGTESTPKDEFNAALDATGASVYSFTDRDYGGYGLKTLVDHFDQNWDLFTQAVLEPAMPKDEVAVRRAKQLAQIASMLESPDSHVSYVTGQAMFAGHPYENLQIGTKENVEAFTRDQLLAYQRAMLRPENMLVVVVGDVDADTVLEKVRSSFGRLEASGTEPASAAEFSSEPGVKFEARQLPTNYILGYFAAPSPGDDDYPAMLVAMDYLRERLFEEVRTKRNLTYAVSSGVSDRRANYGYLYVTAVKPKETLNVMFGEVRKLKEDALTAEELSQTVNVFITNYYMGLETNGSQASLLANSEIVGGDWRRTERLLKQIRAVTPEDIQRVAKSYLGDYRFGVVGPDTDLPPEIFTDAAPQ
jgi:zinc protease